MSKTSVAAKSNPVSIGAGMVTLALALVVAVEAGGVYAQAPMHKRVPVVEVSIVAQADVPAH